MTNEEIIIKISNEILHQVDIEGVRKCVEMAFAIGYEQGLDYHPNAKPIICCDREGVEIRSFSSLHAAERVTRISVRGICNALTGVRPTAGGYIWKYKA